MLLDIEKNRPIPPIGHGPTRPPGPLQLALSALDIGDSFPITNDMHQKVRAAATRAGIRIATRKQPGGFRVWRIED